MASQKGDGPQQAKHANTCTHRQVNTPPHATTYKHVLNYPPQTRFLNEENTERNKIFVGSHPKKLSVNC